METESLIHIPFWSFKQGNIDIFCRVVAVSKIDQDVFKGHVIDIWDSRSADCAEVNLCIAKSAFRSGNRDTKDGILISPIDDI